MSTRSTKPTATKRPKVAAPLDSATRVVKRILAVEPADHPVAWEQSLSVIGPEGSGIERPMPEWVEMNQSLFRTFAFLDISDFTAFTEKNGPEAATEMLSRFRTVCRTVSVRRGARIAKWLGDGVMLVGTNPGPIVATVGEILLRVGEDHFNVHAGIAAGTVLLFEGDDYIGPPVNVAARLCEAAGPGEALAVAVDEFIPEWVERVGAVTVKASGLGTIPDVAQLRVASDVWAAETLDEDSDDDHATTDAVDAEAADGIEGDVGEDRDAREIDAIEHRDGEDRPPDAHEASSTPVDA